MTRFHFTLFLPFLSSSLSAATVVYQDLLAWESVLLENVINTETFNSLAVKVITDGDIVDTPSGVSILGMGGGGLAILGLSGGDFDSGFINADFEGLTTKLVFIFPEPVTAFGFNYVGANDGSSIWVAFDTANQLGTAPNSPLYTSKFFGVTSDQPIFSFSLSTNSNDQEYSIDDLRFSSVPEPSTVGFVIISFGMFALRRKVSRTKSPQPTSYGRGVFL